MPQDAGTKTDEVFHHDHFHVPYSQGLVELAALRERVRQVVQTLPFSPDEIDDIVIAFMEGASNAFRHGRPPDGEGCVSFTLFRRNGSFCISIADCGPGFDPDSIPEPDPDDLPENGMGLFLMRRLMDNVIFRSDNGTVVELVKHVKVEEQHSSS
ncbi:MAG: ATP-binding protein [Armatimonadota bacterium]